MYANRRKSGSSKTIFRTSWPKMGGWERWQISGRAMRYWSQRTRV